MQRLLKQDIANKLNISLSWTSLIINGRRNASLSVAKKFGALTGTDVLIWMEDNREKERCIAIINLQNEVRRGCNDRR